MRRPVMCYVDETGGALAAAKTADAVACLIDAPLLVVHAVRETPTHAWSALGSASLSILCEDEERRTQCPDAVLTRIVGRLHLERACEAMVVRGRPADALAEAAAAVHARAVVVGTARRATYGVPRRSVVRRLTTKLSCPLVIVGGDVDPRRAAQGPSDTALVAAPSGQLTESSHFWSDRATEHGWALASAIAATVGIRPRLVMEPATGGPSTPLVRVARRERAACLVVGARGRGPFRTTGGVDEIVEAAHDARYPVIVVPAGMGHVRQVARPEQVGDGSES